MIVFRLFYSWFPPVVEAGMRVTKKQLKNKHFSPVENPTVRRKIACFFYENMIKFTLK
jgi:hypothetical protein